jgi:hypothetical protein
MYDVINQISIFDIVKDLKLKIGEDSDLIYDKLSNGILFKRKQFKIVSDQYKNFITGESRQFYFICCKCQKRIRKIYEKNGVIGCRSCLSIRTCSRTNSSKNKLFNRYQKVLTATNFKAHKNKRYVISEISEQIINSTDSSTSILYLSLLTSSLRSRLLTELDKKDITAREKLLLRDLLDIISKFYKEV